MKKTHLKLASLVLVMAIGVTSPLVLSDVQAHGEGEFNRRRDRFTEPQFPQNTPQPTVEPQPSTTPVPSSTPSTSPQPSSSPIVTPEPTQEPVSTPAPSSTPLPSPTPVTSASPVPTPSPSSEPTPTPQVSPSPSVSPMPTPVVTPVPTSQPTPEPNQSSGVGGTTQATPSPAATSSVTSSQSSSTPLSQQEVLNRVLPPSVGSLSKKVLGVSDQKPSAHELDTADKVSEFAPPAVQFLSLETQTNAYPSTGPEVTNWGLIALLTSATSYLGSFKLFRSVGVKIISQL